MKSKLSWIPFIPLTLVGCFFKFAPKLMPDGTVFGLSALVSEYIYLGAVVLIFIFALIFTLMDREIAKYYVPRRNIPAGIVGLLTAVALAGDGANSLMRLFSSGETDILAVFEAVFAMLSAIVLVVLGLNHFSSNRDSKRFSLLYVIPALLCAIRMVVTFVGFTIISVRLADVSKLICYIFATMFFYYYAVALSMIKTKNALKRCIMFGFPAVAALLSYSAFKLIFSFDNRELLNNLQAAQMLFFALYILIFLIELTLHVKRDKDIVFVQDDEEEEDLSEEKVEGFLANSINEDSTDDESKDKEFFNDSEADGYLYREVHLEDDELVLSEVQEDSKDYLTEIVEETEDDDRPKNYEDRIDQIDKLILAITKNSKKR